MGFIKISSYMHIYSHFYYHMTIFRLRCQVRWETQGLSSHEVLRLHSFEEIKQAPVLYSWVSPSSPLCFLLLSRLLIFHSSFLSSTSFVFPPLISNTDDLGFCPTAPHILEKDALGRSWEKLVS